LKDETNGREPEGDNDSPRSVPQPGATGEESTPEPAGEEEDAPGRKRIKPGKETVEALLFAADAPLSARQIASFLGKRVKPAQIREWVEALKGDYDEGGRAFQILEIGGGYCLLTRPEYQAYIRKLRVSEKASRLSEAALDTLSVVAYKQPILKADVNQIRGVESGPILKTLMEKGLVRVVGRAETLGRPILYGTSRRFLDQFSLNSLKDLPKMEK
jgi:segregation and condensation protein B